VAILAPAWLCGLQAVQALTAVLYLGPMLVLNAGTSLSALNAEQSQALAYTFIMLNGYAFNTHLFSLRTPVSPGRPPHFQVDVSASRAGSSVGDCWFGLDDVSRAAGRKPSIQPLHRWRVGSRERSRWSCG
jgi:hypothetical protein